MRCPFCQNPCHEETAECSHCGFSLPKLDHYMGTVPVVKKGVSDALGILDGKSKSMINGAIERLEKRFPQVGFTVLLTDVKGEIPLHLYSFWVFNRSTICARVATGGVNRDVLLVIDIAGRRSSLMIGYGLEPFLSAQHLTEVLEAARGSLAEGHFSSAVLTVVEKLMDVLVTLHGSMRRTYGAEESQLGIAKPARNPVGPNGEPIF